MNDRTWPEPRDSRLRSAEFVWGPFAAQALVEPEPETPTAELRAALAAHSGDLATLQEWSFALPWPRFAAVVRMFVFGLPDGDGGESPDDRERGADLHDPEEGTPS